MNVDNRALCNKSSTHYLHEQPRAMVVAELHAALLAHAERARRLWAPAAIDEVCMHSLTLYAQPAAESRPKSQTRGDDYESRGVARRLATTSCRLATATATSQT